MINLDEIKERCKRYRTEEQFDGVYIEVYLADVECLLTAYEALRRDYQTAKGELCLHCGKYLNSHLGLCNNCRWYTPPREG